VSSGNENCVFNPIFSSTMWFCICIFFLALRVKFNAYLFFNTGKSLYFNHEFALALCYFSLKKCLIQRGWGDVFDRKRMWRCRLVGLLHANTTARWGVRIWRQKLQKDSQQIGSTCSVLIYYVLTHLWLGPHHTLVAHITHAWAKDCYGHQRSLAKSHVNPHRQ
jgi:hypothetical protein